MWSNTKTLSTISILIVILGFGFLWFGLNSRPQNPPFVKPQAVIESQPSSTSSATLGIEGQQAFVTRVVDGDTIDVLIQGEQKTIRLLGMDTPETVDPRKPVQCFGKEASDETKSLLTGKEVILQKDVSETDKYKRLLRFVYLPLPGGQTLFVDDFLVREGFARVLIIPPDVKFSQQFLDAQMQAKLAKKGLWGRC